MRVEVLHCQLSLIRLLVLLSLLVLVSLPAVDMVQSRCRLHNAVHANKDPSVRLVLLVMMALQEKTVEMERTVYLAKMESLPSWETAEGMVVRNPLRHVKSVHLDHQVPPVQLDQRDRLDQKARQEVLQPMANEESVVKLVHRDHLEDLEILALRVQSVMLEQLIPWKALLVHLVNPVNLVKRDQ